MMDIRDMQRLNKALIRYEQLINRPYLYELSCANLSSLASCSLSISLLQLSSFPTDNTPNYFSFILNALNKLEQIFGYIICSDSNGFSVYIGLKGKSCSHTALSLLQAGLKQVFPTLSITPVENASSILKPIFCSQSYALLANAICIPPATDETTESSLMSSFIELMGTTDPYVVFFLANPISRHELYGILDEYYDLYFILSEFNQIGYNMAQGLAKNTSKTITHSNAEAEGCTNTEITGKNISCNQGGYSNISGSTPLTCDDGRTITSTYLQNLARATVNAKNTSISRGNSQNETNTYSHAHLNATNKTENQGINYSVQNRYVQNALDNISDQITRLQSLLNTSCFGFNAYFFSPISDTALRAAYNFSGLCHTTDSTARINAVNFWDSETPYFSALFEQLEHFDTPHFCVNDKVLPSGVLIQSAELVSCLYK